MGMHPCLYQDLGLEQHTVFEQELILQLEIAQVCGFAQITACYESHHNQFKPDVTRLLRVQVIKDRPTVPLAATGTLNIRRVAAGSCSFPTVVKSCRELLQKGSRKRRPKTQYFIRLSNVPKFYVNRSQRKRGLTIELHFQSLDTVDSTFLLVA